MIFDKIDNHKNYRGLSRGLDRALDYLLQTELGLLNTGKHNIDGEEIFAVCMEYETKKKALSKNEAHRRYIDVQYIVSGIEVMNSSDINGLKVSEEYDSEKDVVFYENNCECEITARAGCFAVFFPEDAHIPGLNYANEPAKVKKVVVKVHV